MCVAMTVRQRRGGGTDRRRWQWRQQRSSGAPCLVPKEIAPSGKNIDDFRRRNAHLRPTSPPAAAGEHTEQRKQQIGRQKHKPWGPAPAAFSCPRQIHLCAAALLTVRPGSRPGMLLLLNTSGCGRGIGTVGGLTVSWSLTPTSVSTPNLCKHHSSRRRAGIRRRQEASVSFWRGRSGCARGQWKICGPAAFATGQPGNKAGAADSGLPSRAVQARREFAETTFCCVDC